MKIAYIILHYMAGKDTIECAESVMNATKSSEYETLVIIVDNGSTNNSYSEIKKRFENNNKVVVLHSEENLGFARGNNLGFRYAKEQYQTDFIVQINNDTIINQKNFNEVLVRKYKEKQYAVLGPDIVTADGYHQNPGNKQSWKLKELFFFRLKKRVRIILNYLHMDSIALKAIESVKEIYRKEILQGDVENTILHGACFIFSPQFIERFDGMCDETFLYWEEDILKLQADFYGFLMLYSSELNIFHKEDIATNMVEGTINEKVRRKYKRLIASSKVYSKLKKKMIVKKKLVSSAERVAGTAKSDGGGYSIDIDMPISYLLGAMLQRSLMLLRGIVRSFGMKKHGRVLFIGKYVTLRCKSKMQIGTGVSIQSNVYLDALSDYGIKLGNGCSIGCGSIIRCSGNFKELGIGFTMGNNSSLADNCFVGGTGGVWIGNDVIGGQNIRFHASNHIFTDTTELIRKQGIIAKGIRIGNNCWIGAGAVFCDGITIGDGCVIGANTVITRDFPANSIIAGVPAKLIGKRQQES